MQRTVISMTGLQRWQNTMRLRAFQTPWQIQVMLRSPRLGHSIVFQADVKFRRHILRLSSQQNSNLFSSHTSNYKKMQGPFRGLSRQSVQRLTRPGGPELNPGRKFSIFKSLQIGYGGQPASTSTSTGFFFSGQLSECDAEHSNQSSVQNETKWSYTPASPLRLHGMYVTDLAFSRQILPATYKVCQMNSEKRLFFSRMRDRFIKTSTER